MIMSFMFFSIFGGTMSEARKVGEWEETLPESKPSVEHHEFAGLVKNIVTDIGVSSVIDFGCGEGSLCQIFSAHAYQGIDIDDAALALAQEKFSEYSFNKSIDDVYSSQMCIAARTFHEITDKKLHDILKKMRCQWLLVAEPLSGTSDSNVLSFNQRTREDYVSIMRSHDLLLFKHMVKSIKNNNNEDVSFLLFKKCERNPIHH